MTEQQQPDTSFQGEINPADMVVSPHEKIGDEPPPAPEPIGVKPGDPRGGISELSADTPTYGTETPYRKTPPTNYGSVAENAATGSPPTAASPGAADAAPTPVCTAAPVVTGTPTSGQTLTTTNGTWSPAAASYGYQWYRDDVAISGATANTRVLAAGDVGKKVFCRVTGKSSTLGGSSPADSNVMGPVS